MNFEEKMVSLNNEIEEIEKQKIGLIDRAKTALFDIKQKLWDISEKQKN